jgi:hypothetical protein
VPKVVGSARERRGRDSWWEGQEPSLLPHSNVAQSDIRRWLRRRPGRRPA